jgi:hypothetical protein
MSPLARRDNDAAALPQGPSEVGFKANQNKILRFFRRIYLNRELASTTFDDALGSRGRFAY